jgi:hypothetical protein
MNTKWFSEKRDEGVWMVGSVMNKRNSPKSRGNYEACLTVFFIHFAYTRRDMQAQLH